MPRLASTLLFSTAVVAIQACSSSDAPAPRVTASTSLTSQATPAMLGPARPTPAASKHPAPGMLGGRPHLAGGVNRRTSRGRIVTNTTPTEGLVIPTWTGSFSSQGTTFPYAVVGSDPALGTTTTIPTVVVPIRLVFPDGTVLDPSSDSIDGTTPLAAVSSSPIFNAAPFSAGSTTLGTTQWVDAVARAEFWNRIPASDGYHVLFSPPKVLPTVTLQVPPQYAYTYVDSLTGRTAAYIDQAWAQSNFDSMLVGLGMTPDQLPILLLSETSLSSENGGAPWAYHGAHDVSGGAPSPVWQTYIETTYFGPDSQMVQTDPEASGVGPLGHEVAEWLMDPGAYNMVPGWQVPGLPNQCFSGFLEVADPLEFQPATLSVPLGGGTYTLPDVALLPWFARDQSQPSVNGWDTLLHTYTQPSTPCTYDLYVQVPFWFTDATGAPVATFINGMNDQHQAVLVAYPGSSPVGYLLTGFDPASGNFGTPSMVSVPVPGQPGNYYPSYPKAVGNDGTIVGQFSDATGMAHGYVDQGGTFTTIDVPGASSTGVQGLNNRTNRDIVGWYVDASGAVHGFVLRKGKFVTVDVPSGTNTVVNAINDHRQIVGYYSDANGVQTGFQARLDDSDVTNGLSGFVSVVGPGPAFATAQWTQLTTIANSGEVMASLQVEYPGGGYLQWGYDVVNGNFEQLSGGQDSDDGYFTVPQSISTNGTAVGWSLDATGIIGEVWVPYNVWQPSASAAPASLPLPAGQ
jgi:hypothetical protein